MSDDALTTILRRLDMTHQPDPRFASELLTTLRPLALDAARRDATLLGRVRDVVAVRAAGVAGPRPARLGRLALVAAVAAVIIGLLAAQAGRAPARPFFHDSSFGFFRIDLAGESATATAVRGLLASSPSGSYLLVDRGEPSDPSLAIFAPSTGVTWDLPSEPGDVLADWSADDRLAWAVRPANVDEPPRAIHLVRPGQDTILTWDVPGGSGTSPTGVGSFQWSPDGRRLAVATIDDDLADHLYVVDATTGEGRELGDGVKPDRLAWSPDGGSIAASLEDAFDPTTREVDVIAIDVTTGVRTHLGSSDLDVIWSTDGSLLVTGEGSLWRIDPGRPDRHLVATSPDIAGLLFPSPDGSMVAFIGGGTTPDLWVLPSAGGEPRLLADGLWYRGSPSWSPDNRWILFTRGAVSSRSLWMVRPDGSSLRQIAAQGVQEIPAPTLFADP